MQELVRLRQQQQGTDSQLQAMVQRLQVMEQRQQQMMSFLAKAVQSPHFLAQFLQQQQQQSESNRRISEANKKRRLKQEGIIKNESAFYPDGQIVKYQPSVHEQAKAMLRQLMKMEPYKSGDDSFLLGNGTSSTRMDMESSPSHVSGVTLQEMPPTSLPRPSGAVSKLHSSSPHGTSSEKVTVACFADASEPAPPEEATQDSVPSSGLTLPEFSEMLPETGVDIPPESFMDSDMGSGAFADTDLLGNGSLSFGIGDIPPDTEIDPLIDYSTLLEDYLASSPMPDDVDSKPMDAESEDNETEKKKNEWNKTQNMDELTEQMGLLSPETKGLPRV